MKRKERKEYQKGKNKKKDRKWKRKENQKGKGNKMQEEKS